MMENIVSHIKMDILEHGIIHKMESMFIKILFPIIKLELIAIRLMG